VLEQSSLCRFSVPLSRTGLLAFGGDNVSVESGSDLRGGDRQAICRTLTEGGVLTADRDLLRQAARTMLIGVLSCRENRSQTGVFARMAGDAIGASSRLQNMATEEFLSCLSRGALETMARAEGVPALAPTTIAELPTKLAALAEAGYAVAVVDTPPASPGTPPWRSVIRPHHRGDQRRGAISYPGVDPNQAKPA
jgi:hypothetical protein